MKFEGSPGRRSPDLQAGSPTKSVPLLARRRKFGPVQNHRALRVSPSFKAPAWNTAALRSRRLGSTTARPFASVCSLHDRGVVSSAARTPLSCPRACGAAAPIHAGPLALRLHPDVAVTREHLVAHMVRDFHDDRSPAPNAGDPLDHRLEGGLARNPNAENGDDQPRTLEQTGAPSASRHFSPIVGLREHGSPMLRQRPAPTSRNARAIWLHQRPRLRAEPAIVGTSDWRPV